MIDLYNWLEEVVIPSHGYFKLKWLVEKINPTLG